MTLKKFTPKWGINRVTNEPQAQGWRLPALRKKPINRDPRLDTVAYNNRYVDPPPFIFPGTIGVNIHTDFDVVTWYPYLAAAGIKWVRTNALWSRFQPTPESFDWIYYDRVFSTAALSGINLLFILIGTPIWALPNGQTSGAYPPVNNTAYGDACNAFVSRYGKEGTFWSTRKDLTPVQLAIELWNEPYNNGGWGGIAPAVSNYTTMARAGLNAIRAAGTSVQVGLPVEAGSYWIPGIAAADSTLLGDVDFVSAHPYLSFSGIVNGPRDTSQGLLQSFWRIGWIRDQLALRGYPNKALWLTEFGFTNATGVSAGVTESVAANWTKDALDLALRHFKVNRFFYYDFSVSDGNMSNQEGNFGLLGANGLTTKPAWNELIKYGG